MPAHGLRSQTKILTARRSTNMTKPTRFVAFGRDPGLPGVYTKQRITPFEVRRFCKNDGEGFWSLVRGDHASLIATETLRTSVFDCNHSPPDTKNPGAPSVGDQTLVVMPPADFTALSKVRINRKIPIPSCELEVWTRSS